MQDFFQTFWDAVVENRIRLFIIFIFTTLFSYLIIPRITGLFKYVFLVVVDLFNKNVNLINDDSWFEAQKILYEDELGVPQRVKSWLQFSTLDSDNVKDWYKTEYYEYWGYDIMFKDEMIDNWLISILEVFENPEYLKRLRSNKKLSNRLFDYTQYWDEIMAKTFYYYLHIWLSYEVYRNVKDDFLKLDHFTINHQQKKKHIVDLENTFLKFLKSSSNKYIESGKLPSNFDIIFTLIKLRFVGFLFRLKLKHKCILGHLDEGFRNYKENERYKLTFEWSIKYLRRINLVENNFINRNGSFYFEQMPDGEYSEIYDLNQSINDKLKEGSPDAARNIWLSFFQQGNKNIYWFLNKKQKESLIEFGYSDMIQVLQSEGFYENQSKADNLSSQILPNYIYLNTENVEIEYDYNFILINEKNAPKIFNYIEFLKKKDSYFDIKSMFSLYSEMDNEETIKSIKRTIKEYSNRLSALWGRSHTIWKNMLFAQNTEKMFDLIIQPFLTILFFLITFILEGLFVQSVLSFTYEQYLFLVTILNLVL